MRRREEVEDDRTGVSVWSILCVCQVCVCHVFYPVPICLYGKPGFRNGSHRTKGGDMGGREGGRFRVRSEDQSPRKEEERIKQTNKRTIQPIIISMWLINLLYYFCIHTCICSTRKGR